MKELTTLIEKAYRAYRIYPRGHEIPKHFLRQVWEKLKELFASRAEISFYIERNRILDEEGNIILEGEESEENFSWFLYKGGIKGVVITPQISLYELKDFFEAIGEVNNLDQDKYALLVALNKRNFEGISYEIAPEFIEDGNVFIPETFEEFKKLKEKEPRSEPLEVDEKPVAKIEIPIIIESREVFKISYEEEQLLQEEIEKEREQNKLHKLLIYLIEILKESDLPNFNRIIDAIEELLLIEIKNKNLKRILSVFKNLKQLTASAGQLVWATQKIKRIEFLFRKISDSKLISGILEEDKLNNKEIQEFIAHLKPPVVIDILEIAAKTEKHARRNALLKGISKIEGLDINKITQYLKSNIEHKDLLIAGIELLGMVWDESSTMFLESLKNMEDEDIRVALVKALFSLKGDISPFINDISSKVRLIAYQELKKNPRKDYAELIAKKVLDPSIHNFDTLEKQIFFSLAALYVNNEEVSKSIKKLLNYRPSFLKRIFENKKTLDTINTLIHSLAETKSKKAFEILLEGVTGARYKKVRHMCKETLKNLGGGFYGGEERNR